MKRNTCCFTGHRKLPAEEIRYVSEEYSLGCMKKRNRFMVDFSDMP